MEKRSLDDEFVQLIQENEKIIYKVCSVYVTDEDTMADLYQDVVCNLWRSFEGFRKECAPSTWIYRVLVLPFIGWLLVKTPDRLFFYTIFYWGVYSLLAAIWCSMKVTLLIKIDEVGIIKDNIKYINTYAVWIHKERFYYTVFGIIGVIPMSIIYMLHAGLWQWIFMGAVFIVAILLTIWSYKRVYYKNIRTIQQNLNELKDLEN